MTCPFCNKHIPGITGLQEIKNFMSHLNTKNGCKKNPKRETLVNIINPKKKIIIVGYTDMQEALEIRAKSNQ